MPRAYQPKLLPDGTQNPKWKPDSRRGDRHAPRVGDRHAARVDTRKGDRHAERHGTRAMTKWKRAHFVAWDGEGASVARDGVTRHEYVLLCNSEGLQEHDAHGLPTRVVFARMLREFAKHPDAIHVAFYFGYDVNMILRDCPRDVLRSAWAAEWTHYLGYSFQWRPGKCFALSGYIADGRRLRKVSGTIWDVGGFFQAPFVTALRTYNVTDSATIKAIAEKKLERSTFTIGALPEITRYCQSECALLVKLCESLRENFDAAGLRLTRWDGAGAAATALLERERVKAYKQDAPRDVQEAAQFAYFGGRVELLQFGHSTERIYHYDINSAYPSATVGLPCLRCGRWERVQDAREIERSIARGDFAVWHVRYDFDFERTIFPYPWRADNGAIYFPRCGIGWYWTPEVAAAREWCDAYARASTHTIDYGYRYVQRCTHQPFAFVQALYDQRREWKRAKNGAEKAAKLAINSLYGKCAQTVGYSKTKAPTYHQLEWAGWITSATRAKLFRASWECEDAIVAFATDAIFSRVPLHLPCSDALGQWDAQEHSGGTFVQSGVYWLDDDGRAKGHSRGFDLDSLSRDAILEAWKKGKTEIAATLTRFVGLGTVIAASDNADIWNDWRTWKTSPRVLKLTPLFTKRMEEPSRRRAHPERELVRTVSAEVMPSVRYGTHSAPRNIPWSELPAAQPSDDDVLAEAMMRDLDECYG